MECNILSIVKGLVLPWLSLSAGSWRNSPAEEEVIDGWILVGDHSVTKDNAIQQNLNHFSLAGKTPLSA